MKVLVLNPPARRYGFTRDGRCQNDENAWLSAFPPVMLVGIAGQTRKKYDTKLIDCIGSRFSFKECIKMVKDCNPNFTIINTSMPTFQGDMDTAKQIKQLTKSKIIIYGEFVTSAYKEILKKYKFIDFVVRGEAETPVMNILRGKVKNSGIASINYDGGIWREPDLDKLAMPAYDLFPPYYYPLKGKNGCLYAQAEDAHTTACSALFPSSQEEK